MQTEALKNLVIDALDDLKAQEISEINVSKLTSVTDVMVIATGTSSRHIAALANNVQVTVKEAGVKPLGCEGDNGSDWVLLDLGDVVVHVMLAETRALYDLERLWSDLPRETSEEFEQRS